MHSPEPKSEGGSICLGVNTGNSVAFCTCTVGNSDVREYYKSVFLKFKPSFVKSDMHLSLDLAGLF